MRDLPRTPFRLAITLPAVAAVLLGCPFAQPVPGVGQQDGGTLTPPRIDTASVQPSGTAVLYSQSCPDGGAQFSLEAQLIDESTTDTVEARWFVDYDPNPNSPQSHYFQSFSSPPPAEPTETVRTIPPFAFEPDLWTTPLAPRHVVELVVSNGFAADDGRAAAPGYETQVYRWLFLDSPGGTCGP
jgi:hypothetical protein